VDLFSLKKDKIVYQFSDLKENFFYLMEIIDELKCNFDYALYQKLREKAFAEKIAKR